MDNNIEKMDEMIQEKMQLIRSVHHIDLKKQKRYSEELLTIAKEQDHMYATAFAYAFLADYYITIRNHHECIQYIKKTKELSFAYNYIDLLIKIYIIEGMYHNANFDEIAAVQAYLDGLKLAQQTYDINTQMAVYNNIGVMFEEKDDNEDGLLYIQKAFDLFTANKENINDHIDCVVILNLIELKLKNEKAKEALFLYETYHQDLKKYIGSENIGILYISQLYIAYYTKNHEQTIKIIDYFIHSGLHNTLNRNMYFSFYRDAFQITLRHDDKERAEHLLRCMGEICLQDDISQQLQLHLCWIHFAETFHMENALIYSYKQYYQLQKQVSDVTNKFKAESMREKILVNEMQMEKEHIIKEKQVLESKVKIDGLTKLFNRSYFVNLVNNLHHNHNVKKLGIILIDVDYFKQYNDCYGHPQGDKVLKSVAQCLDINSDSRIFVARYGGDEFICVCVNMDDDEIEYYLSKVKEDLNQMHIEHKTSKAADIVSISAGYANVKNDMYFQLDVAVNVADSALYQVKENGRNHFSRFTQKNCDE